MWNFYLKRFKKLTKREERTEKNSFSMQLDDNKDLSALNDTTVVENYKHINYKLLSMKSNAPYKTQKNEPIIQQKRYSPKDHRTIATIAYFAPLQAPTAYFQSIHNLRPYKVAWSKFALHCAHTKVEYNQLFKVFNASLIGLCVVDEKHVRF